MKNRIGVIGLSYATFLWVSTANFALAGSNDRWSLAVSDHPTANSGVLKKMGFGSNWQYSGAASGVTLKISLRGPDKTMQLSLSYTEDKSVCFSSRETAVTFYEDRASITGSVNCKAADASPADRGRPHDIEGWFELDP